MAWAATTPAAANQAFNIVNGDYFRWSWLWPRLAAWFGVEAVGFDGMVHPLEAQMAGDAPLWHVLANRYSLTEPDLGQLASPWHTDLDLGRPLEVNTGMSESRKLGLLGHQSTED